MERKNKRKQGGMESRSPGAVSTEPSGAPFSPHTAFVVQFRRTPNDLAGRVEHIASGEVTLFSGEHDLFDFFRRVLRTTIAHDKGDGSP